MNVQVRLLFRALFIGVVLLLLSNPAIAQQTPQTSNNHTKFEPRTSRQLADAAFRKGDYQLAKTEYEHWIVSNPRDTTAYINLARCQMRLVFPDRALETLYKCTQAGYKNYRAVAQDTDFVPLRTTQEFKRILELITVNMDNTPFPYHYAEQIRFGRYQLLYPKDYDKSKKYHLVLLLHGNGQDPSVMLNWAKELQMEDVIFVCPEGTYVKQLESLQQGQIIYSAAGEDLGLPEQAKKHIVNYSAKWYLTVLDSALAELPLYNELPILVGFSQGGFYASVLASRHPERFKTVVIMCASYYEFGGIAERLEQVKRYGLEFLHVHGKDDPTVPFQTSELIESLFAKAGIKTKYIPFEGVHWMTPEITKTVAIWIREHFK
ncbi:MAG: hypothetical protein K1X91_09815 [Bacteriodetes bacterium]|nr:hypothetical protein [Bacteroidota bacterium]